MIEGTLNQEAIWKQATGNNGYESTYAEPVAIKVRWEDKKRLIRNKRGEEVESIARVFCKREVEEGDVLEYEGKAWPVLDAEKPTGLDGKVLYRICSV